MKRVRIRWTLRRPARRTLQGSMCLFQSNPGTGVPQRRATEQTYLERRYLSSLYRLSLCCVAISLLLTLAYIRFFERTLLDGDIRGADGFVSLFITDTLRYLDLVNADEWSVLTFAIAGVKNAIVPSLMWDAAHGNWYVMAVFNSMISLVSLIYLAKLCWHFGLPRSKAMYAVALLGLLPSVLYFSVGSLKELPTLLALTGFLYHYLKHDRMRWIFWAGLLIVLRYQLAAILPVFILAARLAKNPLRASALFLLFFSMAYPMFASFNVLSAESTELYRSEADTEASSGAQLESIRGSVPVISAAAIAIRTVQSVLDPLLTFVAGPYLFYDGSISIEGFTYLSTLLLTLPAWYRTVQRTVRSIRSNGSRDMQLLYALVLLYAIPVGGFSFVHGRYLFPLTALVIVGGATLGQKVRSPRALHPGQHHTSHPA